MKTLAVLVLIVAAVVAWAVFILPAPEDNGPTQQERDNARDDAETYCSFTGYDRFSEEFANCVRMRMRETLEDR